MNEFKTGDVVLTNSGVEGRGQAEIDYSPESNVLETRENQLLDKEGKPIQIKLAPGRRGFVYTQFEKYSQSFCLVNFSAWKRNMKEDEILSVSLPASYLDLHTRFSPVDVVVAESILEERLDQVDYAQWSSLPGESVLARVKRGDEALVMYPGSMLELDFSFLIQDSHRQLHLQGDEGIERKSELPTGEDAFLPLFVNVPPTFVTLYIPKEKLPEDVGRDLRYVGGLLGQDLSRG